jgi:hypothetical protein
MYQQLGFGEKLKQGAVLYMKKKVGLAPASAKVPTHRYMG